MKKLLFLIILTGIAVKLKAQQKSTEKPLEKVTASNFRFVFDSLALRPQLSIKPDNNYDLLFLPKQNPFSNILIASLDKMQIVKPVGKWNMPVVKPGGTVIYTMPIKHLPPIVKPQTEAPKLNP